MAPDTMSRSRLQVMLQPQISFRSVNEVGNGHDRMRTNSRRSATFALTTAHFSARLIADESKVVEDAAVLP